MESPRAHILIVEDHADLAEALALNFRHAGHVVECVRDGAAALTAARTRAPHLIVLDLNLPAMDGFTVLERLRSESIDTPVLILSARGDVADKIEGFRLGADDYVTKPFTLAELLGRVTALLRRASAPRSAATAPPAPPPPTDVIGYTDDELVERFGLTQRQAVVARMVARGLTNPEIAEALAITRLTARNHAKQVIAKVGVTSRGRVATALRAAYDAERAANVGPAPGADA